MTDAPTDTDVLIVGLGPVGAALAGRAIGEHLRSMGEVTSGPPPFQAADRSRYLSALDEAVHRARRLAR